MVAFNFQSRFADAVESGEKRQTIRLKARCKPGDTLQLYVGQRSKRCRLLGLGCCTDVRSCAITMLPAVVIGGRMLGRAENHALAKPTTTGLGTTGRWWSGSRRHTAGCHSTAG